MTAERWLSDDDAIALIRTRIGGSIGRARAELKKAKASGEIRSPPGPVYLLTDDGIVGFSNRPGTPWYRAPDVDSEISEDDLLDWLARTYEPIQATAGKPARRPKPKSAGATEIINALWPRGIPSADTLPDKVLCKQVRDEYTRARGAPFAGSDKTIIRAARPLRG